MTSRERHESRRAPPSIDPLPGRAAAQRDEMGRRLAAGDNLIVFAEGTSNDGNRVLPFKSALLSVAEPRVGAPR